MHSVLQIIIIITIDGIDKYLAGSTTTMLILSTICALLFSVTQLGRASKRNFSACYELINDHQGKHYSSMVDLWNAIKVAADNVRPSEIIKLTKSIEKRIENILQKQGSCINYQSSKSLFKKKNC